MANYRCSGRGPATQVNCNFTPHSASAAMDHFERTNHDVDDVTCIDPDHGIGDHPCDEVLGHEQAARIRDLGYPPGNSLPVCAICGEPITDRQNIEYVVTDDGYITYHERQYHVERCENIGHRFNAFGQCLECDD